MDSSIGSPESETKRRRRHRQILSCKICKTKKIKCEQETDENVLKNYSAAEKANGIPCKQCIKRGCACEYFQKIDTKKELLQKERIKRKEERLARLQSKNNVDDSKKIKKPRKPRKKNSEQLNISEQNITGGPSIIKNLMAHTTKNNNNNNNNNLPILPSAQELLNYGMVINSPANVPDFNNRKHNATLKDLANVVSNDINRNNLCYFSKGLPNPMSPNSIPNNIGNSYNHVHQHSIITPYQQRKHMHDTHQPPMHPLNSSHKLASNFVQRTPSISSPPQASIMKPNQQLPQKMQSPIEITNILKPLSISPSGIQQQGSVSATGMNQLPAIQNSPLLQTQSQSAVSTPSFTEKYFAFPTSQLIENPIRKLDLHSIQNEAVFSCSAISVRPWFEQSKLVKKHKALFDNLKEKSHERRDKENGSGIGSIKKDRMLLLNNIGAGEGNLWDEIAKILPPMHVLREIIVTYFNSNLHFYIRILDRVSTFGILDKYFEVENQEDEEKNSQSNMDSKDSSELDDKILGFKVSPSDNFFNIGIVLQIYRIVMAKQLTETEDDLFRQMEISLNGLSSGYIWSFSKLQFSLLCYMQRHLNLELSDFGFNFKILAEHIASSCLKTGLNKGVHKFITANNKIPEWILRNLYLWAHYFDLIHALEGGSPLIIPFDPIVEEQELKCSERGRDGLIRRFLLLGRKILNALYEPYGRPDIEGMLEKIDEFERLELLPMSSYCNLSTINNVDLFDYLILIPLMNIKLTLHMLRYFIVNNENDIKEEHEQDKTSTDPAYFFGMCFSILAIIIVLREQWQHTLQNKESVLTFKEPLAINVDHLSYFHSLAVQRDLIDKVGITFYEMLYQLRNQNNLESPESDSEINTNYSCDDILSCLISLVLVKQPLPMDLKLKHEDLLKSFLILVERFYKVDSFGNEKQPNIHIKEFETIFRNIYTGNGNLEAALTPRFMLDPNQNNNNNEVYNNIPTNNADSVGTIGGIWQKPPEEMYNSNNNSNGNPPIPPVWSEDDVNVLQLFDVDFTTFLTPFL
ncbi:hypothetical protein ACO0SA_003702 [Hanseniaspora valbyensis]